MHQLSEIIIKKFNEESSISLSHLHAGIIKHIMPIITKKFPLINQMPQSQDPNYVIPSFFVEALKPLVINHPEILTVDINKPFMDALMTARYLNLFGEDKDFQNDGFIPHKITNDTFIFVSPDSNFNLNRKLTINALPLEFITNHSLRIRHVGGTYKQIKIIDIFMAMLDCFDYKNNKPYFTSCWLERLSYRKDKLLQKRTDYIHDLIDTFTIRQFGKIIGKNFDTIKLQDNKLTKSAWKNIIDSNVSKLLSAYGISSIKNSPEGLLRLAHDTFLNNKINATSHSIYKDISRTRNQLGFETETIKEAMKIGLNNLYKEKNSKSIYKFLDHKVSADIKRFKKFRRDNNVESIKAILFHLNAQSYNQDLRKQCKMDISADILFSILHLLKTNDVPDTHIDLLLIKLSTDIRPHFFNSEKSISLIFCLIELMTFLSKQEKKPCTTHNKAYSYLIKSFTGEHSLKTTSLSFGYAYAVILENLMGYKDVTKKYLLDNCVDDNIYITMAHLENIVSMFNFKTILDSSGIAYQPIIDIIKKYHFNQMSAGYKIQAFSNIFIKAIENNDPDSLKPLITTGLLFNTSENIINSGLQETRRHIYDISEFVPESSTFTSIAKTKNQSYRAFICDKIKRIENKNNRSLFASYLIASCANKALQIDTYKSLEINADKLVETCYAYGHIHLISKIYRVMLLVNKEETPLSVMRQAKPELKPYILSIMHD